MKKHILVVAVIALLLIAAVALTPGSSAYAQSATSAPWTSSITYYTPDPNGGTMQVSYYKEGSASAVDVQSRTLQGHAAGSIFIGTTNVPAGFQGGAVISSDVPVVAVNVQFAGSGLVNEYGRLLYSGFTADQAASTFYIPTVLYNRFGSTTMIGIQNVETSQVTVNVKLFAVGTTTPTSTKTYNIPGQSSQVVSASELGVPTGFDGSATIEATGGSVVATSQETDDAGRGAYAFEGVSGGANTVYMATMLCNFGASNQVSFYAVQNASQSTSASVSIDFYNTAGAKVATKPATSVGPGSKISVNPCNEGVPGNTSGSAVIKSTGAPVIAIGKVKDSRGIATAFVGESAGATNVSLPYIRWSANPAAEFRAFIAIMNVGSGQATGCTATYYNANGNGTTTTLPNFGKFIKVNTNPADAGALSNGDFGTSNTTAGVGGAVEISCNQPVVAVTRLTRDVSLGATTKFGEDYNGTPIN